MNLFQRSKKLFLLFEFLVILSRAKIIHSLKNFDSNSSRANIAELKGIFDSLDATAVDYDRDFANLKDNTTKPPQKKSWCIGHLPSDCYTALEGSTECDYFLIKPKKIGQHPFYAQCRGDIAGGGWMAILRRKNGKHDFNRNWSFYKEGFGNLAREFFIGLDKLREIIAASEQELLIWLKTPDGTEKYALYDNIFVDSEEEFYKLSLGNFNGTGDDFLSFHKDRKFTTKDKDQDVSNNYQKEKGTGKCMDPPYGGWWHMGCCYLFYLTDQYEKNKGIVWNKVDRLSEESYIHAEMLIRPKNRKQSIT